MSDDKKITPVHEPLVPRDPLIGTTLDNRFYIEEVLGTGGTSIVYKAKQLRVNRDVAIKTLLLERADMPNLEERFEREIASLCAMNHPNIVTAHDCLVGPNNEQYIVMDYLQGRSLRALIKEEGPLALARMVHISTQICSALDYAHKLNIIHRDLKPGNIVLLHEEMDFVKVIDFGLAHLNESNKRLTNTGELLGSPPYMSPEQCRGEPIDARSDIYSLGCVMYEMLSGHPPFWDALTVFEVLSRHMHAKPPAIIQVNPDIIIPSRIEDVLFKAMEKKPAERYQTVGELQNALVAASSEGSSVAQNYIKSMALPKVEALVNEPLLAPPPSRQPPPRPTAANQDGAIIAKRTNVGVVKLLAASLIVVASGIIAFAIVSLGPGSEEGSQSKQPAPPGVETMAPPPGRAKTTSPDSMRSMAVPPVRNQEETVRTDVTQAAAPNSMPVAKQSAKVSMEQHKPAQTHGAKIRHSGRVAAPSAATAHRGKSDPWSDLNRLRTGHSENAN